MSSEGLLAGSGASSSVKLWARETMSATGNPAKKSGAKNWRIFSFVTISKEPIFAMRRTRPRKALFATPVLEYLLGSLVRSRRHISVVLPAPIIPIITVIRSLCFRLEDSSAWFRVSTAASCFSTE